MNKILLLFSLLLFQQTIAQQAGKSAWVYPDVSGRLVYKTTPAGDRIMDFSYAGYMGGGVALPTVTVKRKIAPVAGDNTAHIQAAINEVAAMPLEKGFRGAVLLEAGMYTCAGTLTIPATGVVLRGSGSGKKGSTIRMTGSKHTAIIIGDKAAATARTPATATHITDAYVPAGTRQFSVADVSSLHTGDPVLISKPVTAAWTHFMEMDNLVRDGKPQTWIAKGRYLDMERKITAINGHRITIDIPLADNCDTVYLGASGTLVSKALPSGRTTQAGVEQLHIQCPPLETAYTEAPYAGIRINGDDCWVKDVYCEETMNTTTLGGNRITMQRVVVKHTFTNLGASKPADFSIEGSQNLIDRCEVTGGNTYFVWTTTLQPGPNVVLNSTFRGHGSRIQPHMRWATGLLMDNCTVPDGGLDFMNRGVAGSGHGWTMGWAVAWNCIASTYVIQNPPGVVNWAIGCIGRREQTARLFDTTPVQPEGIFDSYNVPVTPQSLYLAQLSERLGPAALQQAGYGVPSFNNKHVPRLPPLKVQKDPILGYDLAMHRPVNTSNKPGNTRQYAGEKALDGNPATWWAIAENIPQASLEIDMENPVIINTVEIQETTALPRQVHSYKVEGQVNSDWQLLSQGSTLAARQVDTFPQATVWKVRVTIMKGNGVAGISKVGLYKR